jgi:acyl-CoA hydrolase
MNTPLTTLTLAQHHQVQTADLNPHHTLYAGRIFQWGLDAAYTLAQQQTTQQMVAVGVQDFQYHRPVKLDEEVEVTAQIIKLGTTSVTVKTTLMVKQTVVAAGVITFVNTDHQGAKSPHHLKMPD